MKFKPAPQKRDGIQSLGDIPAFRELMKSRLEKADTQRRCHFPELLEGYKVLEENSDSGIRLVQSKDRATTGIQFSDDMPAKKFSDAPGHEPEARKLCNNYIGYRNKPAKFWARTDYERPHANSVTVTRVYRDIERDRQAIEPVSEVRR